MHSNERAGVWQMILRVLDPTNEMRRAGGRPAARPSSLKGKTIGFISNGKEGTKRYFAQLERMLREELEVAHVIWRTKSNYSAPADAHIIDEIPQWDAVVAGVGDSGSCSSCSLHDSIAA